MFAFAPLSRTLPYWPKELFGEPGGLLDEIGITDFAVVTDDDTQLQFEGTLAWLREIELKLPSLDAVSIALLSTSGFTQIDFALRVAPTFELTLKNLNAAIRLRVGFLRPVKKDSAGKWVAQLDANGDPLPAELELGGADLKVSADGDIELVLPGGAPTLSLPPLEIGGSGIVLELNEIELYLSEKQDPPTGAKPGFKGVAVKQAALHLSGGIGVSAAPTNIIFKDLLIGSSGFSGEIHAQWNGNGQGSFFGLDFHLKSLDFTFVQNVPTDASLKGTIKLPFFDQDVSVEISVDVDGGLSVALDADDAPGGLYTFTKTDLLEMTLDSIGFEVDDGIFTAKLGGKIKPLAGGLKWPTFDVQELAINSKGEAWVEGGWIALPRAYTLNLHLFKLEITKFGIGKTDDGRRFLGFSGGLDLIKGIPAGANVEGLRITFDDNFQNVGLTMKGVGVEFSIPGTLDFKGFVSYDEPDVDLRAFAGELKLNLPTIDLKIDAVVVFGSDRNKQTLKRYKYFALYADGEFGTGIPLLNTGIALKGIAALFSVNYAPDKPDEWMWYSMDQSKSWFHKPKKGVTDLIGKWAPEQGTLALGAGVLLATASDNGYLFSGKFLLLFLFPGPVIMLDGRCDFLKKPTAKSDSAEPMFHSLIVLDTRAGYFLAGLDAKWKYDAESGKLVEIAGSAEAYFNYMDPRLWHIYIGQEPLAQRIQANFAGAFQANAYFMLDGQRLALGVWIGKNEHYQFGPVGADLEAWLDANAVLSVRPAQLAVGLWLHGLLAIKVFKFRFAIGLDARLSAQVAKPFHILGTLTITIETRLKDFEIELRLEWGPRPERPAIAEPFKAGGIAHLKSTVEWPLDGNDLPLLPAALPAVPLDSRPWLTFEHPVHDASGVSLNPAPDPGSIMVGNRTTGEGSAYVHYTLQNVAIEKFDGSTWTALPDLYGSWAAGPPNPGAGGAAANQNRLMLYVKNPFEMTDESESWNPWVSTNVPNYPCPVVKDVRICIDWEDHASDSLVTSLFTDGDHPEIELRWDDGAHRIVDAPVPVVGKHRGILFAASQNAGTATAFVLSLGSGTVVMIDTALDQVVGSIKFGKWVSRAALMPDGSRIIVADPGSSSLRIVDVATRAIVGPPLPHPRPLGIAIHPDGTRAYVTSDLEKHVSVIDIPGWKVAREIQLDDISVGVTVLRDGSRAYVTRHLSGLATVIDTVTDTLVGAPINVGLTSQWDVVATPDSGTLFIPGGNDQVAVLNTATHVFEKPITVQKEPMGLAMAPDGARLWVTNAGSDSVSVIEVASRKVIATIPVGTRPLGIAITPDGTKVYVTNSNAMSVTVIDTATNQVLGQPVIIGSAPWWIVIALTANGATFSSGSSVGSALEITVPEGAAMVEVAVSAEKNAKVVGRVVEPAGFENLDVAAVGELLSIDARELKIHDGIRRVVVTCDRPWILMRVCYVRPSLPGGLAEVSDLHDQLQQSVSVWGAPGAVFEPRTKYRVRAKVARDIDGIGKLSDWHPPQDTFERYWFFETAGPPGLATFTPPANVDPAQSAIGLEDLTRYVAQTMPPTLTPEGERPRLRRPVFRAYDVGADFNEDYVDRMYELAERDLAVQIYDASDRPVRSVRGDLAVLVNPWGDAAEVQLTETRKRWLEVLDAATCMPHIDVESIPRNKTIAAADHVLDPNTLYEARLVPLLLRAPAPKPGDAGWSTSMLQSVLPVLERTDPHSAPQSWTDLFARFELQPTPTGLSGIVVRLSGTGCYVLAIDVFAARRSLIRVSGGIPKRLDESAFAFDANKSYRFAFEAIGPRLRVVQDGEAIFDVEDAAPLPAGTIALLPVITNAPPRIVDLAVHDFRKGAPVAYRFAMTTSDYVDFHHQIHSFQDEVWRATPQPLVDLASAAVRVSDPKTEVAESEARAYEELADAMLHSAARQLPERLEVTRLEQNDELQALLVRCDEPIDWSRTEMAVQRLDGEPLQSVVPGTMKLTRGAFDWMQLAGDVVEVLLREPVNPTGARVEALLLPPPLLDPAEPPLFVDRFADNDRTGWTLVDELPNVSTSQSSSWQIIGSELQLANTITADGDPAFLGTFAAAGDASWTDVVFSVQIRSTMGGAVGIVFRGKGLADYYRFSMDSQQGYRQLVKKIGGAYTVLWRDDVAYDPLSSHELTIVAVGGSLRGYLNGVAMFAVEDDAHASGIIACYVAQNEAYFSAIRVDGVARVAREWLLDERFDTSLDRWSFEDVWEISNGALVAPALAPTAVASALAGDAAWRDLRIQAQMRVGETGWTEVVFRVDADRFYALRFDTDASELRLLKRIAGVESSLGVVPWTVSPTHEVLVTIDCIGTQLGVYVDGRPLIFASDDEIAAGRVGVRVRGTTDTTIAGIRVTAAVWTPWHTFENEQTLDAGTRVEIYGGPFDLALPPVQPGTIRRLAPAGTRRRKLPLECELRIVDPAGTVQHARRFIPTVSFAPMIDVDLMRNADGTGFFILPRTATAFAKGTYRLAFVYHRNQPGVQPILSRAGSQAAEFAAIDIPWTSSS